MRHVHAQRSTKNRRVESTSTSSEHEMGVADTLSAADIEAIVEKAVKAAVKVVTEELQKKCRI